MIAKDQISITLSLKTFPIDIDLTISSESFTLLGVILTVFVCVCVVILCVMIVVAIRKVSRTNQRSPKFFCRLNKWPILLKSFFGPKNGLKNILYYWPNTHAYRWRPTTRYTSISPTVSSLCHPSLSPPCSLLAGSLANVFRQCHSI